MSASRSGVDTSYMRYSLPVTLQTTHILLDKVKLSTVQNLTPKKTVGNESIYHRYTPGRSMLGKEAISQKTVQRQRRP